MDKCGRVQENTVLLLKIARIGLRQGDGGCEGSTM